MLKRTQTVRFAIRAQIVLFNLFPEIEDDSNKSKCHFNVVSCGWSNIWPTAEIGKLQLNLDLKIDKYNSTYAFQKKKKL